MAQQEWHAWMQEQAPAFAARYRTPVTFLARAAAEKFGGPLHVSKAENERIDALFLSRARRVFKEMRLDMKGEQEMASSRSRGKATGKQARRATRPTPEQATPLQEQVNAAMRQGIAAYQALTEEHRIPVMESMVINLAQGRVILYGKNPFEGPVIEYRGPFGSWRCSMTSTLRLKGEPRQER